MLNFRLHINESGGMGSFRVTSFPTRRLRHTWFKSKLHSRQLISFLNITRCSAAAPLIEGFSVRGKLTRVVTGTTNCIPNLIHIPGSITVHSKSRPILVRLFSLRSGVSIQTHRHYNDKIPTESNSTALQRNRTTFHCCLPHLRRVVVFVSSRQPIL
jgi:hypothetical protein